MEMLLMQHLTNNNNASLTSHSTQKVFKREVCVACEPFKQSLILA